MFQHRVLFTLIAVTYCAYGQNGDDFTCTSTGQLRLVNGRDEREGRVEICIGGVWGTVCDDLWDSRDAEVVCRQLGFRVNGAIAAANAHFGPGTGPIVIDNIECEGTEEELLLCPQLGIGEHNCIHTEDASVICQPIDFSCEDGAVRLMGGELANEGRVEICFDNQFGTVCDDGWGNSDAAVVCAQLGFSREDAIGITQTLPYGVGVGYIFMDDVRCQGTEKNLTLCPHRGLGIHNCKHNEDAGVLCKPNGTPSICQNEEIRLVGGRSLSEGRVEICFNEHWGTVCDDRWGPEDARVICRQLGFSPNGAIALTVNAFGPGTGAIFLDNLGCRGTEPSLSHCINGDPTADHNCNHLEDVGVVCQDSAIKCVNGSIRLVNGTEGRPYEGRVEVCINNHWGTVCDDFWDSKDATVVCNQLGYPGTSLALPRSFYGRGRGVIWATNVKCSGNEDTLLQCPHKGNVIQTCSHSEDANVICTAPEHSQRNSCTNGDVRIVNGSIVNEGRVELCFSGHWGTVCGDNWSDKDAAIVCKQLGYEGNGSLATVNAFFGEGNGPIFLDNVQCIGNESILLECVSESVIGQHNCQHSQDAGVICPASKDQRICDNGDVRLRGGASDSEGRVEICINSRWGTVCAGRDVTWNSNDANVVCSQLGFNPATTRGVPTFGSFGKGDGPIFLNNVHCFGNEKNLLECSSSGIAIITDCGRNRDVGIVCTNIRCSENTVRLKGGVNGSNIMGKVEVCVDGKYCPVNAKGFGNSEAEAVCKRLGLGEGGFQLTNGTFFGMGEGGRTYSLALSPSGDISGTIRHEDSSHTNEIGLICLDATDGCESGKIRLAGGQGRMEGRVELCLNNQWGTICDDSWDKNSAAVVCRQLGFSYSEAEVGFFGGNRNLPVLIDDLKCNGSETNLLQCRRNNLGNNDCTHMEDAGVRCKGSGGTSWRLIVGITVPIAVLIVVITTVLLIIIFFVLYTRTRMKSVTLEQAPIVEGGNGTFKFSEHCCKSPSIQEQI